MKGKRELLFRACAVMLSAVMALTGVLCFGTAAAGDAYAAGRPSGAEKSGFGNYSEIAGIGQTSAYDDGISQSDLFADGAEKIKYALFGSGSVNSQSDPYDLSGDVNGQVNISEDENGNSQGRTFGDGTGNGQGDPSDYGIGNDKHATYGIGNETDPGDPSGNGGGNGSVQGDQSRGGTGNSHTYPSGDAAVNVQSDPSGAGNENGQNDLSGDGNENGQEDPEPEEPQLIDISSFTVSKIKTYTFQNKAFKPEVEVKDPNGMILKKTVDYTVSYKSNKNCGTAVVTIKGTGAYSGKIKTNFKIVKSQPKISGVKIRRNPKARGVLKDTITVKNLYNGKVWLQRYSRSKKKWVDINSYTVKKNKASITVKFTKIWKRRTMTKWRIYIPATANTKKAKSKTINVTARNIKKLGLNGRGAVIIRADTAEVLYSKNMNRRLKNASTTKMMTALLCIEKGKTKGKVKISSKAASTPWGNMGMKAGEKISAGNLMKALLICSSNDSSVALAEYASGSTSKFVKQMNSRAKKLGCKNTHFANTHGLDNSKHYSSAYDLTLIQREVMKHPLYRKIIKKKSFKFDGKIKTYKGLTTDSLLYENISGFKGGKTGYTGGAGSCFCGIYKYKGRTYIFCTLGSRTGTGRWNDCRRLMRYIRTTY